MRFITSTTPHICWLTMNFWLQYVHVSWSHTHTDTHTEYTTATQHGVWSSSGNRERAGEVTSLCSHQYQWVNELTYQSAYQSAYQSRQSNTLRIWRNVQNISNRANALRFHCCVHLDLCSFWYKGHKESTLQDYGISIRVLWPMAMELCNVSIIILLWSLEIPQSCIWCCSVLPLPLGHITHSML